MIAHCDQIGMKPLCDHKSYCQSDNASIYIGQDHHIAYPPQRRNDAYFPLGWKDVRENKLKGHFCAYTRSANGNNALCSINNSHQWRAPRKGDKIACVRINTAPSPPPTPAPTTPPYKATLAAKNGVPQKVYDFQTVLVPANASGRFSTVMINECKKLGNGWKPLCDHPSYCKSDSNSIYIGQTYHIALPPHRNNDSYFPPGWKDVRSKKLSGDFCVYTNRGNGNNALCSANNSHAWKMPSQVSPIKFPCVSRYTPPTPKPTTQPTSKAYLGALSAMNGVPARRYDFQTMVVQRTESNRNYSELMIDMCSELGNGWKPLCDHPNYCKNNDSNRSIYIGQ